MRFTGRVDGRQLEPGTYRISVQTASGQIVQRVLLIVVAGPAPTRADLLRARAANVCPASLTGAPGTSPFALPFLVASAPSQQQGPATLAEQQTEASGIPTPSSPSKGILASTVEKTAHAARPFLLALLALSILLLGAASLPGVAVPERHVNALLTRHRLEVVGFGAAALVAAVIALFF